MAQIDDFKANLLGGGARQNQFRVTLSEPPGVAIGLDVRRTSFLCSAASLPETTIGTIPLVFRGRTVNIAGDREPPAGWTTTLYNDTDFMIRNAMERWMNGINNLVTNTGPAALTGYQADLSVEQLDRDETVLKSYIFRNAWPKTITAIALDAAAATAIETFDCTWEYQHFEASGVNF